jgi:hypothetical protein
VALTLLAAAALGAAPLPPLLRLTLPGGVLLAVAAALWLW